MCSKQKNSEQALDYSRTSVCPIILLHIYIERAARNPPERWNDGERMTKKKDHKNSNLFNSFFFFLSLERANEKLL